MAAQQQHERVEAELRAQLAAQEAAAAKEAELASEAKASAIKLQSIARFFLVVQWCVSPPRHVSVALPRRPTPLD